MSAIRLLFLLFAMLIAPLAPAAADSQKKTHVALIEMDLMILPGTSSYLDGALRRAADEGAAAAVVRLNTPGGLLTAAQAIVKAIFASRIPVIVYVAPSGSAAISAGVFVTLAGHVAAMANGTSIGAAHPVTGAGEDIKGDMRTKIESITTKLVESIAAERGRNVEWAVKSVKESTSATDKEALKLGVIDIVADDIPDLLRRVKGKEVKLAAGPAILEDYSALPIIPYAISSKEKILNLFANPNVAAILWAGATGGLSIELYNPGAILPGVVGVICLILALAVSDAIPVTTGGVLLLALGAALIGLELYMPSGVLAVGGIVSLVLGMLYLIDTNQAPDLAVSLTLIISTALVLGTLLFLLVRTVLRNIGRKVQTGAEGLVGEIGTAISNISKEGKVSVNGEIWNASAVSGILEEGAPVKVVSVGPGLRILVDRVK